jgi:hypothetical protein
MKKFIFFFVGSLSLIIPSSYAVVFFDDFSGNVLNPIWEEYVPYDSPLVGLSGGGFYQISLPDDNFDHWSAADRAPQLRLNVSNSDWEMETHLNYSYTGGASFHHGLLVYFSQYDTLYWGPYANIDFRLERSGVSDVLHSGTAQADSYLKIVRTSNNYDFYYKTTQSSPWILAGSYNTADFPTKVGLITRSWWGHPTSLTVNYDYFKLNVVPEPLSLILLSLGLGVLALRRKTS